MAYLLRLTPSGNQFTIAPDVDIEALTAEFAEALDTGASVRVPFVLSDLCIVGALLVNTRQVESVEIAGPLPDELMPRTRGLTTVAGSEPDVTMAELELELDDDEVT